MDRISNDKDISRISSTPILRTRGDLIFYRKEMRNGFNEHHSRLAPALFNVQPFVVIPNIPLGPGNEIDPGLLPAQMAANASAAARIQAEEAIERWKLLSPIFRQFEADRAAVCGYICNSVRGETLEPLESHGDYEVSVNNRNYQRLWQLVLELFTLQGTQKEKARKEPINLLINIRMDEHESLGAYYVRFQNIKKECDDFGVELYDGLICSALVDGLGNDYQFFKEQYAKLQSVDAFNIIKVKQTIYLMKKKQKKFKLIELKRQTLFVTNVAKMDISKPIVQIKSHQPR